MAFATGQEMVAHFFAAIEGPHADDVYQSVHQVWSNAARYLRTEEPIQLSAPSPPDILDARQSWDGDFQAILRQSHDIMCLSLLLTEPDGTDATWRRLDGLLDLVIGECTDAFLGTARLYLGKYGDVVGIGQQKEIGTGIGALLPRHVQRQYWWSQEQLTAGDLQVWDLAPGDHGRVDRNILIIAPPDQDRQLSDWAWSDGSPHPAPFTRYLKHASLIRYELRVYQGAASAAELCRRTEDDVRHAQALIAPVESGHPVQPNSGRRSAVADSLARLRADRARVATRIELLQSMHRTVEIAVANAHDALDSGVRTHGGLVSDDAALWAWFQRQLQDDIGYLDASHEAALRLSGLAEELGLALPQEPDEATPPVLGIVTALPEEFVAMSVMINDRTRCNEEDDRANYVVGTMPSLDPSRPHRVALTMLGDTGNDAAAAACTDLARSFKSVGVVLMVGIAAGVPCVNRPERHVRLGDIVVSTWGIVDYDHVVDTAAGRVLRQPFPRPSRLLAQHANWLAAEEMLGRRPWEEILTAAVNDGLKEFARPPAETDLLYGDDDAAEPIPHPDLEASGHRSGFPKVHYGQIGSADRSLRNAATRDDVAAAHDLRALEMEGKGIGDSGFASGLEWLVIRGVSDYGDRRTENRWRKYASLSAAAYTRALLAACPPFEPRGGHTGGVRGLQI